MGDLGRFISRHEVACQCGCGRAALSERTVDAFDELRVRVAAPLYVSSGCRCWPHNAHVGGAKRSSHLCSLPTGDTHEAFGLDVWSPGAPAEELCDLARDVPAVHGLGFYPQLGVIHLDTRPAREAARWICLVPHTNDHEGAIELVRRRRYFYLAA